MPGRRIYSIDALRGGIMVIMALDHVRDFFHRAAMTSSPTDLAVTTPALFFTRWITHMCAPVFMVTAGLGAFLWWQSSGKTKGQLSVFLLTRGLWLVLLELTVMQLAYNFDISASYPVFLLVLWVLGLCMIGLAALVWLPSRWLLAVCVATIALHNLADGISAAQLGSLAPVWTVLHQVGVFGLAGRTFVVGYPLVPWIAVMGLGFALGPLFLMAPVRRRQILSRLGFALMVAFVVLRAVNGYGDPSRWSAQPSPTFTLLSFLNTTKYPPSLLFVLMTLGPALVALAWLDRRTLSGAHPLVIFGRVPLFYFVLHFFAAHLAVVIVSFAIYGRMALAFVFHPVPSMGGARDLYPADFGFELWGVYVMWALIVGTMYPLCRWFARVKARRREWWVSYL
jgi:uncharacterized membrane protein